MTDAEFRKQRALAELATRTHNRFAEPIARVDAAYAALVVLRWVCPDECARGWQWVNAYEAALRGAA